MKDMTKLLLVVDMQVDFVYGALGTPEAMLCEQKIAEKLENFDGEVIFTMDTHDENYLNTAEGKKLPVAHCIRDTDGWMLTPEMRNWCLLKNALTVEKGTFGSVALPTLIARHFGGHIPDITIVGVCTDICVISNALLLKAFFPEASITVDSSCCAGDTPESHENALKAMACCQIDLI